MVSWGHLTAFKAQVWNSFPPLWTSFRPTHSMLVSGFVRIIFLVFVIHLLIIYNLRLYGEFYFTLFLKGGGLGSQIQITL